MDNQWLAYLALVAFPLYIVAWNLKRIWLKLLFSLAYGLCMYLGLRVWAGDVANQPLFMTIPLLIILTVWIAIGHNTEDKKPKDKETPMDIS